MRDERTVLLEHGKPLVFGKNQEKGIRLNGLRPEVVTIGEDGVTMDDLLVHDEYDPEQTLAFILSRMDYPEYPVPMGVYRSIERPTYVSLLQEQIDRAISTKGPGDLEKLLNSGETWVIGADGQQPA